MTFDYTAAGSALDAISSMGTKLNGQTDGRVTAQTDVVVNWAGAFREQFDGAARLLNLRFTAALESAGSLSGSIHQAVTDANTQRGVQPPREERRAQPRP